MVALSRFLAIATKEVRQLARDRLTFGMIVGIPLLQILLFGYAINMDVRNLSGGVADLAHTQTSRSLVQDAVATQVVSFRHQATSAEELVSMLRTGKIKVGLYIPPDFERRLADPSRPSAQLLIDGSDPSIANIAQALADMPFSSTGMASNDAIPLLAVRNYYNPEGRSAVQIVPALIGVILSLTMVLFTAVAIVRERERGNLELLITTPIRNFELMAGKISPYIVIGIIQVTIIVLVGILLFDVPIRGSITDLYLAALIFITATLGLGLFISTVAKTQFQAMQLTFFTFLPQILLSGFMFPYDGMPPFAQWIAQLLPLTHFVELVRGIILRGATLTELTSSIWPLALFFILTMTAAVVRFSKRLD